MTRERAGVATVTVTVTGAAGWRAAVGGVGIALALGLSRVDELALCGAAVLPWVLASRSSRRTLSRRLRALLPVLFALSIAAAWSAAFSGEGGEGAWSLEALRAPAAAQQTWLRVTLVALRVLVAALYLTFLTHDLSVGALERALQSLGLPESFVTLLVTTRRFGGQLTATLEAAWAAGVLRGGLLSMRALAHTIGAVAGVVLVRSIDRSESIATASALRGGELRQPP